MAKIRTHYDNLRVARNAPDSVIKAAYKALCQTYHPDKFQGNKAEAERIMKLINTSYSVLIDPIKRAEHDAWIKAQEVEVNHQSEKATFSETGNGTEQSEAKHNRTLGVWVFWIGTVSFFVYIGFSSKPESTPTTNTYPSTVTSVPAQSVSQAITEKPSCIGNCINGQGTLTWEDGDKQGGEFKDGKANGHGTYTINGGNFVGEFKDNERNGQGIYTSANGDKFVGEFKDDKPNGQGTLTGADGSEYYVGEFKDGNISGQGTMTYPNGDKYVGEFKDDNKNGQGTYTYPDGDKYVGEFKDGGRNGQGTFTFSNGDKYVGDFKDDKVNGQGIDTLANGDKYVGEFKDGKANGQGTFTSASGNKYVGEFKDDKKNGQGTETKADGVVKSGLWKNDKFVK